jgi:hypothetical protein
MRLFAQRIASAQRPVHCYIYLHGTSWAGPPPPELVLPAPTLVRRPPAASSGDAILSYFTVLAPDDVVPSEIGSVYSRLFTSTTWVEAHGRCLAQFSCEQSMADVWRSELQLLFVRVASELTAHRSAAAAIP